jgi:hypothetical protein
MDDIDNFCNLRDIVTIKSFGEGTLSIKKFKENIVSQ